MMKIETNLDKLLNKPEYGYTTRQIIIEKFFLSIC